MGQEFIIKSQQIEDKINQLLPSQGGFQAGVDFSASTTVIPIVDLTETAEGSSLRADLQTSLGITNSAFELNAAATTVLVNTTGFYRVIGTVTCERRSGTISGAFNITDGTTDTKVWNFSASGSSGNVNGLSESYDFNVFLAAGHSLECIINSDAIVMAGSTRQIADIAGNLTNPTGF